MPWVPEYNCTPLIYKPEERIYEALSRHVCSSKYGGKCYRDFVFVFCLNEIYNGLLLRHVFVYLFAFVPIVCKTKIK